MGFFVIAMTEEAPQWRKSKLLDLRHHPRAYLLILALFFVLAVVSRILRSQSLETDEIQQVVHFLSLEWGYGSQPPLYEWLQYLVFQITGPSILGLSILKNGVLFLGTVLMAAAVRAVTPHISFGALAAFALLSMPTVFLMTQRDLSHTAVAIACVCLFFWSLFKALNAPSLFLYVVVGIAVGLGAISKYNFVVIPSAALVALLLVKEFRPRVLDWKILATLGIAAVIVSPHALWVLNNLDVASAQTLQEMKIGDDVSILTVLAETTGAFIEAALKAALPILGFFLLLFPLELKSIARASNRWTQFVGWTFVISLILVYITLLFIGATEIRQKWLAIYFVALPLYLALKFSAAGVDVRPRLQAAAGVSGLLFVGVSLMLLGTGILASTLGRPPKAEVPFSGIALALQQRLGGPPAAIMTNDSTLAANLLLQFPKSKIWLGEETPASQPGAPAVFVTMAPPETAETSGNGELQSIEISSGGHLATRYVVYYSILHPSK